MPVVRVSGKRDLWRITVNAGRDPATGKRKRTVRHFHGSKHDALAEMTRLQHEIDTGQYVPSTRLTVAAFMERWLDYMRARLAPSALASYESIVRTRLVPELGAVPLQQLQTAQIIAAERRWLESGRAKPAHHGSRSMAGLSPKTVANYHRVLVEALNYAVRWDLVRVNVAGGTRMEPPRWEHREMATLSLAETQRLLDVLPLERHGAALYTLVATALRVGELLGLRWRDVDLDNGTLHVEQQYDRVLKRFRETKSHRSRRPVAIDTNLIGVLRHHRAEQASLKLRAGDLWTESGLVFTDNLGGHLSHDQLRYALERALRHAGVGRINPHGLRHTHASLLLQLGTHMKLIQERLGHASFGITADTYSHLAAGMQRSAADNLGAALRPPELRNVERN